LCKGKFFVLDIGIMRGAFYHYVTTIVKKESSLPFSLS